MQLKRLVWLVIVCIGGLVSMALPVAQSAELSGSPSYQQLQQQIVENLAKGKDVQSLVVQLKTLSKNGSVNSSRKDYQPSLQQPFLDMQLSLRRAGKLNALDIGGLNSVADAYQILQANHLLFKARFTAVKQTLSQAGAAGLFESRRKLEEDHYDQTFKGLTDILDPAIGALQTPSDSDAVLADSARQQAVLEAIRRASSYLDAHASQPPSPILRAATMLPYRQATLVQRQPLLEPQIQPSYLNPADQVNAPQAEDSVASQDAPLSEEILLQAKALQYDYIRIYEFVRNTMRTQWYAGSMKGAVGTLRQKSGNDIDQASLLIALFRASGLPARYVHGVIELPIEDVMNSLGVIDATQAATALTRAGVAYNVVIRGGRIAAVNVEHTWVSVYVPYTNYRGATVDKSGATWLPLTPALKNYQINSPVGIYANAGLAAETLISNYLDQPQSTDLLGVVRKQIGDYLQAQGKGASYEQQLGSIAVVAKTLGLLPNTLPVTVVAVTREEAVLSDKYRQQIRFIVRQGAGDADPVILDYAVPLSLVQSERVTLSYIPASVDDQKTVDLFGGLDYTPPYLIKLRAQIKVNGQQKSVALDALDAGVQHRFEVAVSSPNGTERIAQTVVAGGYHAVGVYAQQVARIIPENDPADTEFLAAKLLDAIAYQYVDGWDKAEQEFSSLMNVTAVHPWPSIAIVSNSIRVDTLLGRPMQLKWQGVTLDAALRIAEPVSRNSDKAKLKEWMQLTALQGSILEHQLFEKLFAVESISADKGLALARSGNIPVQKITPDNSAELLPTLALPANVIEDVTNWLRLGLNVEVPVEQVSYKDWRGAVWRVEEPNSGAAGYFIAGGLAGGSSAEISWVLRWLEDALAAANTIDANMDPLSGVSINTVSGDNQQGEVGTQLEAPLSVLVRDAKGKPVVGAEVTFAATAGAGLLIAETGSASSVVVLTNRLGVATTQYELGKETNKSPIYVSAPGDKYSTLAGMNNIDVSVGTYSGVLALAKPIQAIGLPGKPAKLTRTNDCCIGESLPDATVDVVNVQVRDQYNNSISNIDVNFTLAQLAPSSKGGTSGKLKGTCAGCEGLSLTGTTTVLGTSVAVNLGSGYVSYNLTASSEAGSYSRPYEMYTSVIVMKSMSVINELGRDVAATKTGQSLRTSITGGISEFDEDARTYGPATMGNLSSSISNGGGVSQPGAISSTEWQVSASAGASPGVNIISFTAPDVLMNRVRLERGDDREPKYKTITWEVFRFYGVNPSITGVEGAGVVGGVIPINEDGLTQGPASVNYSVNPAEYYSIITDLDVLKDGALESFSVGSSRTGSGTALLMRDNAFDVTRSYTAQLVLNRGTDYEVRSDSFRLPLRQTIIKNYSHQLHVSQDVDTLNQRVCSKGSNFSFTITQPAAITLTAIDQDNPNSRTTLISGKSYPKGENSELFLPSDLRPGKYTFELTAVSEIDGHSETAKGGALSEHLVRNALPIGHVIVKGVDLKDGHLFMGASDLSVPGRGIPLDYRRSYSSSASFKPGELGTRWSHNYASKVTINSCGEVIVIGGEGGGMRFVDDGNNGLKPLKGHHGTLIANNTDHTFDFYSKDGTRYHYRLFSGRQDWDLEFIQDVNGNLTKLAYDPTSGLVAKLVLVEDSAGRTLKFKYEDRIFAIWSGLTPVITEVEGPDGMKVSYEYDDLGNLIKAARENNIKVETYSYSPSTGPLPGSQVLIAYTNPENISSKFTYNAGQTTVAPQGGAVTITLANSFITNVENGEQASTKFTYGADWLSATVTDANNHTTSYEFNQYGSPLKITDAAGTTSMVWSADDIVMSSKTNARSIRTDFTYDINANLLAETTDGKTTRYTYETFSKLPIKNRVKTKTDPNGKTTTFGYDDRGNMVSVLNPENGLTRHVYAGNGDRVQTVDALAKPTRYTYDTYGYLETQIDAAGGITETQHNIRGLPTKITGPRKNSTLLSYDPLNRLISKTNALNGVRSYTYDKLGNKLSETDEEGRSTSWAYDNESRVKKITNAAGQFKTFTYDNEGNKTAETDWDANLTTYAYDGVNRLVKRTEPLGKITSYNYDEVGNVTSDIDALGRTTKYTYDALNRRTSKIDAAQGITQYTYDNAGNKTAETDPLNHTTSFTYDGVNRLVRRSDALGGNTQYTYDANGNRIAETDALSNSRYYTYDALNRVVKLKDAIGYDTNWVYDAEGNVVTEVNARLFATTHQYDALNRRIQTTDAAGYVTTFAYDNVGNRIRETWPNANVINHSYDALNRLTSSHDSLGQLAAYAYDANGNRTQETDARNNVTSKTYDVLYRLTQVNMPEARSVKYSYDLLGNKTSETDARSNITQFTYDNLNRLTSVTDPLQQVMQYNYDAAGNKLSETDKRGNTTSFTYDALNRLLASTDAMGQVTRATYDAVGNKKTDTDKRGTRSDYVYDKNNRLISTTKAGITLQSQQYDEVGNIKFKTDANGNNSTFIYDGRNLLLTESHPLAAISNYEYDEMGNRTWMEDPEHRYTTWNFDVRRRMLSETNGEAAVTRYTYDDNGNRTRVQRPNSYTWTSAFDAANRLISITDPHTGVTRYTYDGNNNRTSQHDANGNPTTYQYDALNRQTAMIYADGATVTFVYDANGNRTQLTDAQGKAFDYTFDKLNRLTQSNYPLPAASTGDDLQSIVNTYDPNGNLTGVQETYSGPSGARTTTRNYDNFDRLTSVTDGFNKTLRYIYDANGNRTALTDPDGKVTRYTFDELNRVSTVTNLGGTTSYAYDRSSLKTKVAYPNGTTAANTYDRTRRILTLVNRQGAAPVSSYAYSYDANGNRTQQIETNGGTAETTTYAFDRNDRLTTVNYPDKQVAYTYDNNANRLSETTTVNGLTTQNKNYTYNSRNQLTNVADLVQPANDAVYGFDANGNQTSKTQGAYTTYYSYDSKDQLIAVKQNNTSLGVFSYDYQGHRIVKDMGGSTVRYAYDGNAVLVETDTSGTTLAKFDYGPDRLLSMNHATEGRAYYLFDALGSVSNLTNTAGGIQARYQYDAWGNYRSTAGSSFNRFAYTGHEKDNETNLYYFKARYYDPDTGRFINQDAYLGDINTPPSLHRYLYAYANPTVYIDLTGYESISAMIDNAAEGCGAWSCAGWALLKGGYHAATFGFATVHDPVRDQLDKGDITDEQYRWRGLAGGAAMVGVNVAGVALGGLGAGATTTLASTVARGAAVGGVTAGGNDAATQGVNIAAGLQDSYDLNRTITATTAGAVLGGGVPAVAAIPGVKSVAGKVAGAISDTFSSGAQAVRNIAGKTSEVISESVANLKEAVRSFVTREGKGGMAVAETASPAVQRSVGAEVSVGANNAGREFSTTDSISVNGARAIDRGKSYEVGVRNLYGDISFQQRQYTALVKGDEVNGVADAVTSVAGKETAVEAKYVDNWSASLRNPNSQNGTKPWAVSEQQTMVNQASKYSAGFDGGVIYHTNSTELAAHYTQVFNDMGITNFRFVISPATK